MSRFSLGDRYRHFGQFAPLGGEQTAAQLPGDWVSIGHSSQWLWYSVYARYTPFVLLGYVFLCFLATNMMVINMFVLKMSCVCKFLF